MNAPRRLGLRVRLLLLVAVAVLPALTAVVYAGLERCRTAAAAAQADALHLARQARDEQAELLQGAKLFLHALSGIPDVGEGRGSACNALFADLTAHFPIYDKLLAARPDGEVYCSHAPLAAPVNLADRDYFRKALATRGEAVGSYLIARGSGVASLPVARSVLGPDGEVRAVLVAGLRLDTLGRALARAGLPQGSVLTVVDRHGTVLARYPDDAGWVGQTLPEAELLRQVLARREGTLEGAGLDGVSRLCGFTELYGPEGARLEVIAGIPAAAAYAQTRQELARSLLLLAGAAGLALLAAWIGGGAVILRPVRGLLAATEGMARGDLGVRTALGPGGGELGELAAAFDRMAEELQVRDRAREEARSELQQQEAVLRERQDRLELLNGITGATIRGSSVEDVVRSAVEGLARLFPRMRAAYSTVDPTGRLRVVCSAEPPDMPPLAGLEADLSAAPEYLAALAEDRPFAAAEVAADPRLAPLAGALLVGGTRAVLDVPLLHHSGELFGLLWLDVPHTHHWTDHEIQTVSEARAVLGTAIREIHAQGERQKAEVSLRRANRALRTLTGAQQAVGEAREEPELLEEICRLVVDRGGYRMAWVGLAEKDEARTLRPVARAGADDGYLESLGATWDDGERGRGPAGTAIRTGRPCVIRDIATDSRFAPWRQEALRRGFASALGLPLRAQDEPFAALTIYAPDPDAFEEDEVAFLADVARVVSRGIETLRAKEALRRSQEQLQQAQRLEAVGLLAGGVAHDFNNLLQVIMGRGELLLETLGPEALARQGVGEMVEAGQRAANLTRQLLAFSRKQVLEPRVLDLNHAVRGIEKMIRRLIGEDIDIETHLAPALETTLADPGQIEQILVNLALNARDAMPRGGKLTFETGNVELDAEYARRHAGVTPGPHVMLAVSDTGHGMPPEVLEHLFEPFFTTKERGKGTGLGLATVYGIVKQSGGHIWVYSEPGRGSTFKVYLPRIAPAEAAAVALSTARAEAARRPGTETVLVVEDEDGVRATVAATLRAQGYTVHEARTPGDALLRFEPIAPKVGLLITDVVLPDMSGRELAERLQALRPGLRVLYMSGYTDNAIVHHGVLDPGLAFLQKPFTRDALARKVREVLDK